MVRFWSTLTPIPDGDAIAALLFNFFNRFWPELFREGKVFKVLTPLVVAKKGKSTEYFYTNEDYRNWESITDIKKWDIEYKKGLASLEDDQYEEIIKNPRLVQITEDVLSKESLKTWFGGDPSGRKIKLLTK